MYKVGLLELSKRERERVEWKENVADVESVIKTCGAKQAKKGLKSPQK